MVAIDLIGKKMLAKPIMRYLEEKKNHRKFVSNIRKSCLTPLQGHNCLQNLILLTLYLHYTQRCPISNRHAHKIERGNSKFYETNKYLYTGLMYLPTYYLLIPP